MQSAGIVKHVTLAGRTVYSTYPKPTRKDICARGTVVVNLKPGESLRYVGADWWNKWCAHWELHDLTEQIAQDDTPWYDMPTASHHVRGFPCAPFLPADGETGVSYFQYQYDKLMRSLYRVFGVSTRSQFMLKYITNAEVHWTAQAAPRKPSEHARIEYREPQK